MSQPLLVITTLILFLNLRPVESSTINGSIYPSSISLPVGTNLTVSCIIEDPNYSNSKMNFQINNVNVDEKNVKKIGKSKIEMVIYDMQRDFYNVICRYGESGVLYVDYRVGTEPEDIQPSDFKCISHNWDNMTCTFPKRFNPVKVDYNLTFSTNWGPRTIYICSKVNNADVNFVTFEINSSAYRRFHRFFNFTLTSTNALGSRQNFFEIDHFAVVLPDAATNFLGSNVTSRSAHLSWNIGSYLPNFPRNFDYEFSIDNKYQENSFTLAKNRSASERKYTINLPFAHTWYTLKLRFKSNVSEMWSEWSLPTTIKTEARRPDNPPEMEIGSFNIGPGGDFYIYWKHLLEKFHNGENFSYSVQSDDPKNAHPNKTTHLFAAYSSDRINKWKDTWITVISRNEKGNSVESSRLLIPAENRRVKPPQKIVKTLANETYKLSWSPPVDSKHNITSYTVFWCVVKSELPNSCESSINFIRKDPSETTFELSSKQTINFAVSANTENSTSGMVWSSCTAANSRDIGKINTIWIPKVTSNTIEIEWKLECRDAAIVEGFEIEYCPIKEPRNLSCNENEKQTVRNISQKYKNYRVEGLKPYTTYKINLKMFSSATMGPASDPLVNTTLEAAPSEVQDLIARNIGNDSVELFWKPPEFYNGVLLFYQVTVNGEVKSIGDGEKKVEAPGLGQEAQRVNFTCNKLKPYTQYAIAVQACTQNCSKAVKTNIKTTVGVPGMIYQPMIVTTTQMGSNYSKGEISWGEPEFKGGRIDFYELKISEEINGEKIDKIVRMRGRNCEFYELCSRNVKIHGFSVRAVNFLSTPHATGVPELSHESYRRKQDCSLEDSDLRRAIDELIKTDPHGSFLKGNWSTYIYHSCNSKDLNAAQIAILVGSLCVTLVMLITFRYFYKEYRRMKDIFPNMPPGLEDLTGDKMKKEKKDKKQDDKPDILQNVDNTSLNCEDENKKLLRDSRNNSINENDCSSSMRSGSTQSDMDHHDNDDIGYGAFENNDNNLEDSLKQFIINPSTGEVITLSPSMKASSSTPSQPRTNLISNLPSPMTSNGYVTGPPSSTKASSPYVAYSIFNPLQSSAPHTALSANLKSNNHPGNDINEKLGLKTPIVATTDQDGISGYVTHRQLSDFGHRMQ